MMHIEYILTLSVQRSLNLVKCIPTIRDPFGSLYHPVRDIRHEAAVHCLEITLHAGNRQSASPAQEIDNLLHQILYKCRRYLDVGLFAYLTLTYFFTYDVWMIIIQNLFILPQIVHNARVGNNPGF